MLWDMKLTTNYTQCMLNIAGIAKISSVGAGPLTKPDKNTHMVPAVAFRFIKAVDGYGHQGMKFSKCLSLRFDLSQILSQSHCADL